jgi:uncharacterized membrane protein
MEGIGTAVDATGVLVMVTGLLLATLWFAFRFRAADFNTSYRNYRQAVGRAILLGLELLVAGDIIRTVAVAPTLQSVTVLAVIVVIRTFLSMALQLELDGRWPWQKRD